MASFTLLSPAKLNLALEVIGRRPDGFHELCTVFERIDLADSVTFQPAVDGCIRITSDHPAVPCDQRNLVYKAALLLREGEGVSCGVHIHIKKRIPVAAGLAGGSSNGATALIGLNRLWRLKLSTAKLIGYAKRLGSDVAFFLYDAPFALGTGRGEKIRVLDIKARFWHVLVTPKAAVFTKEVYGQYAVAHSQAGKDRLARLTKVSDNVSMLLGSLKKSDVSTSQRLLFNDLEGAILAVRPRLLMLKKKFLKLQPQGIFFSGSGPSVFALTERREDAEKIARCFRKVYKQVFVVRTA